MAKASAKTSQGAATWQRFGNVAQIISALASVAALIFVVLQLDVIRKNAQRANARQVYLSYSQASLRYPQFIRPDYDAIKTNPVLLTQYKWYVSQMLWAFDEILSIETDPEWEASFRYDLKNHLRLLCEIRDPEFFAQYDKSFIDTVTAWLTKDCAAKPQ